MILKNIMDIVEYEGRDWQIVEMSPANDPEGCGEPEVVYHLMDLHGNVKPVLDWELSKYEYEKKGVL